MKMTVVAVGKLKERFWSDACAEYLKRLQPYARITVKEVADVDPGAPAAWMRHGKRRAQPCWQRWGRAPMCCCSTSGANSVPAWNSLTP